MTELATLTQEIDYFYVDNKLQTIATRLWGRETSSGNTGNPGTTLRWEREGGWEVKEGGGDGGKVQEGEMRKGKKQGEREEVKQME